MLPGGGRPWTVHGPVHAELHRQRWTGLIFRVWVALAVGLVLPADGRTSGADAPLLPDLVALPPTDLYLSREVLADGQTHLLLRFTATAWNAGEGRLELVAVPEPDGGSAVWQVLYDAPTGGRWSPADGSPPIWLITHSITTST